MEFVNNTQNEKANKKLYILLIISAFMLYLMSICIKTVYSAQLVTIMPDFDTTKQSAGLGLTFYYIVYALTQLLLATKIKIKNMRSFMIVTTVLSSLSFGAIIFVNAIWQVWIILALNGIFQSSCWGGIMHYFGKYLPDTFSAGASLTMSFGVTVGTALSYGASAAFVSVASWKHTFLFFAILTLIFLVFFCYIERLLAKRVGERDESSVNAIVDNHRKSLVETMSKKEINRLLVYILLINFLCCCLYYGITNWVPSVLKEIHGVPDSYSMLITILMPVGMMFGPVLATRTCEKHGHVFAVVSCFILICTVTLAAMIFTYDKNIVLVIILSIVTLFFNRGAVNTMSGYLPLKMKHVLNSGNSAMLFNAAACTGAAVMPVFTGFIMDEFGWQAYYTVMCFMSLILFCVLCVGAVKQGKKELF